MLFALLLIAYAYCADYTNPIISAQDLPDPGVYVDNETNTYYIATTTVDNSQTEKYPIHISSDLVNWKFVGNIFSPENKPNWAVMDFWAPGLNLKLLFF
jgi:beta-xylosidase